MSQSHTWSYSSFVLFHHNTVFAGGNAAEGRPTYHIIFAFASAVLLFLYLLAVVIGQLAKGRRPYRLYLVTIIGIILISIYLLVRVGIVSSALEIFVTVSTIVLSERLVNRMKADRAETPREKEMPCKDTDFVDSIYTAYQSSLTTEQEIAEG